MVIQYSSVLKFSAQDDERKLAGIARVNMINSAWEKGEVSSNSDPGWTRKVATGATYFCSRRCYSGSPDHH